MSLKLDGIAGIVSGDKVNNGVWIHLDSPKPDAMGRPDPFYLDTDKRLPVRALVRSNRCRLIREAEARVQRDGMARLRTAKKSERDRLLAEGFSLSDEERFALQLVSLDNASLESPGIQVVDHDTAVLIYRSSLDEDGSFDWLVQQVREASIDDTLYLSEAEIAKIGSEEDAEGNGQKPAPETRTPAARRRG